MTTRLDELQAALDAATTGPWDYDTTMTDGEYGDGGPDSHIGFRQFVIIDANGDTICDTTNRDGMLVEVVEHIDEDGWDARDVLGEIDAAAIVLLRNNASDLLAVARAAQRYLNGHNGADGVALHDALAKLTGDV